LVDPTELAALAASYVGVAAAANGIAVIDRAQGQRNVDQVGDVAVDLGVRLLRRLLSHPGRDGVLAAVAAVARGPQDEVSRAALQAQIKVVLLDDGRLHADVADLISTVGSRIVAAGGRSIVAQTISGIVVTGDSGTIQR
jgi:hypothetical protein